MFHSQAFLVRGISRTCADPSDVLQRMHLFHSSLDIQSLLSFT